MQRHFISIIWSALYTGYIDFIKSYIQLILELQLKTAYQCFLVLYKPFYGVLRAKQAKIVLYFTPISRHTLKWASGMQD